MSRLLRFEFRRLVRSKSFYICTALFLAMNLYTIHLAHSWGYYLASGLESAFSIVCSSEFLLFFAVFAALFTCDDYSGGTIRNILARGFSRTQVYLAKLIVLLCAALVMTVVCGVIIFIAASTAGEAGLDYFDSDTAMLLCARLLLLFAMTAFYYALSTAIGKTGVSIAACLLLDTVVALLLGIAILVFDLRDLSIADYWITTVITDASYASHAETSYFTAALCYFFGSTALGYLSILKREF